MGKRALCIGINYPGTNSELRGCVNDALLWKDFLSEKGYEVTMLVDEPQYGTPLPTRQNILDEMRKISTITQDNDYIALTYSGHGSYVRDQNGDEDDNRDETICPCDYDTSGMIIDDEIKLTLLDPLPEGAHFFGLMDCCHSGTSLDLQYNINDSIRQNRSEGHVFKTGSKTNFVTVASYRYRWLYFPFYGWYYSPYLVYNTIPVVQPTEQPTEQPAKPSNEHDIKCGDAVMFSGCSDSQTSADAYLDGKSIGAFTYCMYESFKNKTNDVNTHHRNVNNLLSSHGFSQRSNVSMSRKDIKELHLF